MTRYEVELTDEQARAVIGWLPSSGVRHEVLTAVIDAIRANPPKPPRMAEPGWGGSVTASTFTASAGVPGTLRLRRRFVRFTVHRQAEWIDEYGRCFPWDDLIDPEPYTGDPS